LAVDEEQLDELFLLSNGKGKPAGKGAAGKGKEAGGDGKAQGAVYKVLDPRRA
jgi:hypothetical protein